MIDISTVTLATARQWLAIIAAAIAGGALAQAIGVTYWPGAQAEVDGVIYANSSMTHMLTAVGAVVGFWFAYTGRLARLFRKV